MPPGYFVDRSRDVPLVVHEATGEPHFAIVSGQLVPYHDWRDAQVFRPRPPARAITLQSGDSSFSGTIEIS
jgi:hypothetical protein